MSREEQKQIILNSEIYKSGAEFSRVEAGELIKVYNEKASYILSSMAREGLLVERKTKKGGNVYILYSKPPTLALRMAWRQHSDAWVGLMP